MLLLVQTGATCVMQRARLVLAELASIVICKTVLLLLLLLHLAALVVVLVRRLLLLLGRGYHGSGLLVLAGLVLLVLLVLVLSLAQVNHSGRALVLAQVRVAVKARRLADHLVLVSSASLYLATWRAQHSS